MLRTTNVNAYTMKTCTVGLYSRPILGSYLKQISNINLFCCCLSFSFVWEIISYGMEYHIFCIGVFRNIDKYNQASAASFHLVLLVSSTSYSPKYFWGLFGLIIFWMMSAKVFSVGSLKSVSTHSFISSLLSCDTGFSKRKQPETSSSSSSTVSLLVALKISSMTSGQNLRHGLFQSFLFHSLF